MIVTPLAIQRFMLLQRNLINTGITRRKKQVVLIGQPHHYFAQGCILWNPHFQIAPGTETANLNSP